MVCKTPNKPVKQSSSALASIIIPAYNAERFIARTLQSALKQDLHQFEIIVIDDGSTDRTSKIVSDFCKIDARIRIISTSNSGVAAARNVGIQEAATEIVAFLDADDLWHPAKLRLQVEALQEKPEYAAVYTWSATIDVEDNVLWSNPSWKFDGFIFCRHIFTWPVGNGSSLAVRRKAALTVGGFDSELRELGSGGTEDLDFELRLAERYKITCIPDFLVGYRIYQGNMSSDGERMARSAVLTVSRALKRNPALPRQCVKLAKIKMYRYAASSCPLSITAMMYIFELSKLDAGLALKGIGNKFRRFLAGLLGRSILRILKKQSPVSFYKWNPSRIYRADWTTIQQVVQLEDIDQMLEPHWSKPWDKA